MREISKKSGGAIDNRRRFPRIAAAHLASLQALSGAVLAGRTMDLGLDGLGIELYGAEALGEAVTGEPLSVSLAMHGELVELDGVIMRCRRFEDGGLALALRLPAPPSAYRRLLAETFADAA